MRKGIRDFSRSLDSGDVALFYYAGHGMQVDGENFLIPVNAGIEEEYEIPDEAVSAEVILRALEQIDVTLNIAIFDACRDNPFSRSFRSLAGGLARMNAPSGTLVAYATAPGQAAVDGDGNNGLNAGQLLRHMSEPGLTLEQVFKRVRKSVETSIGGKQIPWEESSLTGDFYFVPGQPVLPRPNDELSAPALQVEIEGPESTTLGERPWYTFNSDTAVRARWAISGFTNGWVDADDFADGHQIYIEPNNTSRVGDWFTLVVKAYDENQQSIQVKNRFQIVK